MIENYWDAIEPFYDRLGKCDGLPNPSFPMYAFRLYAMHYCDVEICNGGFSQLFVNSTGELAPAAEEGFRLIGREDIASLLRAAMAPFGQEFPRDWEERNNIGIDLDLWDKVDELNVRYYGLPKPYDDMDAYARRMVLQ
ncbi:MAG: DUF4375 domain-containing protein [Phycisphaerales bacterium]